MGLASASGEAVIATLEAHEGVLLACHEEALTRELDLFGSMGLAITLEPGSGGVTVQVPRSNIEDLELQSCIVRSARALPWPAVEVRVEVVRPLVLVPPSRKPRKAPVVAIQRCLADETMVQVRVRLERGWPRAVAIKSRGVLETRKRECVEQAVIDAGRQGRRTGAYYVVSDADGSQQAG